MPYLAMGTFRVRMAGPENEFIKNQPAEFTFFPLRAGLYFLALAAIGLFYRYYRWVGSCYSLARYLALAPGLLGILLLFLISDEQWRSLIGVPLIIITLILTVWSLSRAKNFWWMQFLGWLTTFLSMSVYCWIIFPMGLHNVIKLNLFLGTALYLSWFAFCLLYRRESEWLRWFFSVLLGLAASVSALSIHVLWILQAPAGLALYMLALAALFLVPFALLARWNSWVRDLVQGRSR